VRKRAEGELDDDSDTSWSIFGRCTSVMFVLRVNDVNGINCGARQSKHFLSEVEMHQQKTLVRSLSHFSVERNGAKLEIRSFLPFTDL